jgi:hypothetical protein
MAKQRIAARYAPVPRVVHYVDPATPAELAYPLHPAQLAAKQQRDRALYARWVARQQAIAERDRKLRRFWLGFGAVFALALLTVLVVAGWLIWHALTALSLGVLAVPLILAAGGVLLVGGHKCVTVVQHWH